MAVAVVVVVVGSAGFAELVVVAVAVRMNATNPVDVGVRRWLIIDHISLRFLAGNPAKFENQ